MEGTAERFLKDTGLVLAGGFPFFTNAQPKPNLAAQILDISASMVPTKSRAEKGTKPGRGDVSGIQFAVKAEWI
jgi:hypothetical protein